MNQRLLIFVAIALVLAGLKIFDAGSTNPQVIEAVRAGPPTPAMARTDLQDELVATRWPVRPLIEGEIVDLFAPPANPAQVAIVAPTSAPVPVVERRKRPVAPPPVAAPIAPSLPFTPVGDWTEDGKTTVFLSGPRGTISVQAGEVLLGSYRVDRTQPGLIALTYLPLQQAQQLNWAVSP